MDSPAVSNSSFTHEPLPNPAKYIRLLELLDDDYSKIIKVRCRLTTWPIDRAPRYHAISYTWGDAESNTNILMNGRALKVRTNCELALKQAYWYKKRQFYLYRTMTYYWIDAICIDQSNLGEKGQQVAMMGSIYKNASLVLACIGDHADDSLFVFQTFYGSPIRLTRRSNIFRFHNDSPLSYWFCMTHRFSTPQRFLIALIRLVSRPYFSRLWVLQELKLAQKVNVLCGQHSLSRDDAWNLFCATSHYLKWYNEKCTRFLWPPTIPRKKEWFENIRVLRRTLNYDYPLWLWDKGHLKRLYEQSSVTFRMVEHYRMEIFHLLHYYVRLLQCADLKDKVYGIISLIDWGDVAPPKPDYTKSDLKVAAEFLDAIMKHLDAQEVDTPMRQYFAVTVSNLKLDAASPELTNALAARRGSSEICAAEPTIMPIQNSTLRLAIPAHGWRISAEEIEKNSSILQGLQPFGRDQIVLPKCAAAGDWVIDDLETQWFKKIWYGSFEGELVHGFKPLLIMREAHEGDRNPFIGYGFQSCYTGLSEREGGTFIDVYFGVEDGIVFYAKLKQMFEKKDEDSKGWMLDLLDTGVCKQETPGSSYGIIAPDRPRGEVWMELF